MAAPRRFLALVLMPVVLTACATPAKDKDESSAGSDQLIGHVHGLGVDPDNETLYAAGHFGVFRIEDGVPIRVADRWQDTMAFTVTGPNTFLASGHPDLREEGPPHLGLIESTDGAETWRTLSLSGQADFHAIEAVGDRIYAYDATSGQLMVTSDRKTWETLVTDTYVDLAVDPARPERVLATSPSGTVDQVGLDGSKQRVSTSPGLVLLDATPQGRLVGVTADGEVYATDKPAGRWARVGSVRGTPAALEATGRAWHVATDKAILSSDDGGATWTDAVAAPARS